MRLTESQEMTEDVIQDIFLKLWQSREKLAAVDNLGSYMIRMAQNQCITHFRRVAKETLILAELQKGPSSTATDAENNLSSRELQQKLHEALAKLTPQQRLVYSLSREQGLKHDEIARQLNISISTVKNHMIQALSTIREQFRNYPDTLAYVSSFLAILAAFEK